MINNDDSSGVAHENGEDVATTIDRVVGCLKNGYTLVNRGTGWFLSPKYVAYLRQSSEAIEEMVVEEMQRLALITVDVPYLTAKASLCDQGGE